MISVCLFATIAVVIHFLVHHKPVVHLSSCPIYHASIILLLCFLFWAANDWMHCGRYETPTVLIDQISSRYIWWERSEARKAVSITKCATIGTSLNCENLFLYSPIVYVFQLHDCSLLSLCLDYPVLLQVFLVEHSSHVLKMLINQRVIGVTSCKMFYRTNEFARERCHITRLLLRARLTGQLCFVVLSSWQIRVFFLLFIYILSS
jgi:hypothetical protein